MRPRCAFGAVALLLLPTQLPKGMEQRVEEGARTVQKVAEAAVPEELKVLSGTVSRNSTLGAMLRDTLSPEGVHRIVEAARPVYDLARISVGHPFGVTFGPDGLLAAFTYGIDELRVLKVTRKGEDFQAEVVTREHETRPVTVDGNITSSLFAAVAAAGEEDQLAIDLAEIFAWDVDFNTELQKGDSFRVAVEKTFVGDTFARYGRILSAQLIRGDRVIRAIYFESPTARGYYTPDGTPLRKAFLRSPLKFTRISSGFTKARFHPILHRMRAHLGVDFAAPTGTPVRASGDGVVTQAGWSGGFGKVLKIRHPNGYQTLYGHLSRMDVKPGKRVQQGDIIGAVGSTGLSTGPHLDYRMAKDGVFVNPLAIKFPTAEPIPRAERAAFEGVRDWQLTFLTNGEKPVYTLRGDTAGAAVAPPSSAPGAP
jgi:murein DD-endopeptidase MepM/ murein hydrolase activator NlpD